LLPLPETVTPPPLLLEVDPTGLPLPAKRCRTMPLPVAPAGDEPAPVPLIGPTTTPDVEADGRAALAAIPGYGRVRPEEGAAEGMLAAIPALFSDPSPDGAGEGSVANEAVTPATKPEAAGGVAADGPRNAPRGNGPMKSGG